MASIITESDECPGHRNEKCLNCKHDWGSHSGWRCPIIGSFKSNKKSELASNERYLTSDMQNDCNNVVDKTKSHICPCGIIRRDCDYHK